jgi:membrane dipeptidase
MNPEDDEVKQIADTGGVLGVIFYSEWLFPHSAKRADRLANVVDTVVHFRNVAGAEAVALGSDFDGMTDPPDDLREPADFPRLTDALLQRLPSAEVEAVLGGNFLRVLEQGWG